MLDHERYGEGETRGTDGPAASAPLVTAPVPFHVQFDDDLVEPDACRALVDSLGSTDKAWSRTPVVTWTRRGHPSRTCLYTGTRPERR